VERRRAGADVSLRSDLTCEPFNRSGDLVDLQDEDVSAPGLPLRSVFVPPDLTKDDTTGEFSIRVFRNVGFDDDDPHRSPYTVCGGFDIAVGFLDKHFVGGTD
jgi:hypothetical protein